jgi:hypothetical protein
MPVGAEGSHGQRGRSLRMAGSKVYPAARQLRDPATQTGQISRFSDVRRRFFLCRLNIFVTSQGEHTERHEQSEFADFDLNRGAYSPFFIFGANQIGK